MLTRGSFIAACALIACASASEHDRGAHPNPLPAPPPLTTSEEACAPSAPRPPDPCASETTPDAPSARPEELYTLARNARDEGRHCDALRLAERLGLARMTPALRLFLAREQREVGRTRDASRTARQCVREAEADPSLRGRDAILAACRELMGGPPDPHAGVVLRGESVPRGLRLLIDGAWIDAPGPNAPREVGSGEVTVAVFAPGALCCRRQLRLAAGDQLEIELAGSDDAPRCGSWRVVLGHVEP